jgi:hypothetical protein
MQANAATDCSWMQRNAAASHALQLEAAQLRTVCSCKRCYKFYVRSAGCGCITRVGLQAKGLPQGPRGLSFCETNPRADFDIWGLLRAHASGLQSGC